MDAEISLLHRHTRPNARDQLPMSDDFSGPLNRRDQGVERATTELECLVPLLELPLGREQAERAERDDAMHQMNYPASGILAWYIAVGMAQGPRLLAGATQAP